LDKVTWSWDSFNEVPVSAATEGIDSAVGLFSE
jgi:hypothetical protein